MYKLLERGLWEMNRIDKGNERKEEDEKKMNSSNMIL